MKGKLATKIVKNLPLILTVGSMLLDAATAALGIYEGRKLEQDLNALPEDASKKDKAVIYAKRLAPVILAAVGSSVCSGGAQYKNAKNLALVVGGVGATQINNKKLQDKAEELIGKKKIEKISPELSEDQSRSMTCSADAYKECWFHDKITGYFFRTTLKNFWDNVKCFNDMINTDNSDIGEFYSMVVPSKYETASIHEAVRFGPDYHAKMFNPILTATIADDMTLMYEIKYLYAEGEAGMIVGDISA